MNDDQSPMQLSRRGSAPAGSHLSPLLDSVLAGEPDLLPACSRPPGCCVGTHPVACAGIGASSPPPPSLLRHRSSPAGFLSQDAPCDAGGGGVDHVYGPRSLGNGKHIFHENFQEESLSCVSGMSSAGETGDHSVGGNVLHSAAVSELHEASWDNTQYSLGFTPSYQFANTSHNEVMSPLDININSQINLSETLIDTSTVKQLLQLQKDAVHYQIRAKRGCATHPRSIAERVRRTKISEKLKMLQEIVPNMDKQTSTAEMLDLAVEHIRILQSQIQTLEQEWESCTCMSIQDVYAVSGHRQH